MRHLKAHRKLGRTSEHRISLLRNLATSLVNSEKGYIITTVPKAKELRPFVEKVITIARRAQDAKGADAKATEVHLRRMASRFFHSGNSQQKVSTGKFGKPRAPRTAGVLAVHRLFSELGPRYSSRNGGYTRIIKLGRRSGDNAEMAVIELVDR